MIEKEFVLWNCNWGKKKVSLVMRKDEPE